MADRERIVEVMAEGMHASNHCPSDGPSSWLVEAQWALAALEAAGYAWYRPDECKSMFVPPDGVLSLSYATGSYRLVPVGGDS